MDIYNEHITLVDLREKSEYLQLHIIRSINFPASLIKNGKDKPQDARKKIKKFCFDEIVKFSHASNLPHIFLFYSASINEDVIQRIVKLFHSELKVILDTQSQKQLTFHVSYLLSKLNSLRITDQQI